MENNICVLIMAGGSGERFWPLSTKRRPKQLLRLIDSERSLIRMTVDRVLDIVSGDRIFVGTNALQAEGVLEELPMLCRENIIIEPAFRDTAAAIGFGSLVINNRFKDSTLIVLASDHLIKDEGNFREVLLKAVGIASKGDSIITLGIKPNRAETGYGYLETDSCQVGKECRVIRFCEKPNADLAKQYVDSGRFLWNSGMFVFNINTIFSAFRDLMPNHFRVLNEIKSLGSEIRNPENMDLIKWFMEFEKISIDYGIMEKYHNTMVIPTDFGWNDIGSFPALEEVFEGDENGNIVKGTSLKQFDSKNNIIISSKGKNISIVGIEDLIIVEGDNDILVCSKKSAQEIKKVIS